MFERIVVRNWQSLRHLDLNLGRFTVIVGASSSGKSALIRAIRAVASNVSGTSSITRGKDTAAITVHTGQHVVTLEHARGAWRYRLVGPDGEREYTKLNRSVPEDITTALGIDPLPANGFSINLAGQFDPPFLLAAPKAEVARTLGELTNVDRIYAAVRDANRSIRADNATLATRRADLERLTAEAARFAGLRDRLDTCARAETTAERVSALTGRAARLRTQLSALEAAERTLARTPQMLPAPDVTPAELALGRLHRFRALLTELSTAEKTATRSMLELGNARGAETGLHRQIHQLLQEAGTCPTCERPVEP